MQSKKKCEGAMPLMQVIYVESIGNPLLNVPDLKGIVAFAKKHNLTSVVDSTFAPPVNFRPAALGVDCVLHSATKYANGHSDVCAGILSSRADIIDKVSQPSPLGTVTTSLLSLS